MNTTLHNLRAETVQMVTTFLSRSPTLLAFDFDGTLSPIVTDPDNARLAPGIGMRLSQLCERFDVAVITGRSVEDIRHRLPPEVLDITGNHGLEPLPQQLAQLRPEIEKRVSAAARALGLALEHDVNTRIEQKNLSLSVHYRGHPQPLVAEQLILSSAAQAAPGFRIIHGKMVISLVPENLPHKGNAVIEWMHRKKRTQAIFVGDDVTDEDVFAMHDERILGIKIGKNRLSAAQLFLPDQRSMIDLLDLMLNPSQLG